MKTRAPHQSWEKEKDGEEEEEHGLPLDSVHLNISRLWTHGFSLMNGSGPGTPGVTVAGRRCYEKTVLLMCHDAAEELLAESDVYSCARSLQGKGIPWLAFLGVDKITEWCSNLVTSEMTWR